MSEPEKITFDVPDLIPELQYLGVLAQVADFFSSHLTREEMARAGEWFHSRYAIAAAPKLAGDEE